MVLLNSFHWEDKALSNLYCPDILYKIMGHYIIDQISITNELAIFFKTRVDMNNLVFEDFVNTVSFSGYV